MIRLLNLGPAKHEKVAIYVVNQRISNVCRIAELLRSGAIRRHQFGAKHLCLKHHNIDKNRYIRRELIPFSTGGGNK